MRLFLKGKFKSDYRESNPGLHSLYVRWAIRHILIIDQTMKRFYDQSNLNFLGLQTALWKERAKLIKENAAYAEAEDFLKELAEHGVITKYNDIFLGLQKVEG